MLICMFYVFHVIPVDNDQRYYFFQSTNVIDFCSFLLGICIPFTSTPVDSARISTLYAL
jgi:hypothetical protein